MKLISSLFLFFYFTSWTPVEQSGETDDNPQNSVDLQTFARCCSLTCKRDQ